MREVTYILDSVEQTARLGEAIADRCRGGEVFDLVSDLGGGKTTLVKAIAEGLGSTDEVSSPSFTINNRYAGGRLVIEHFDFYRLAEAGVVAESLKESIGQSDTVVCIEWGEIVHNVLPDDKVTIRIHTTGEHARQFICSFPASKAYLFEGLSA